MAYGLFTGNPTIHAVFRDDLIRLSVGVPPSGGVDEFHRRVGCVKPDGSCMRRAFSFSILSWEFPFPGRGGLLPGLKPAAAQAGFHSSLDPGAAGGGK